MINSSVSIVIPVMNADESLKLLLHCIYSQTLLPKEIIIVGSGSEDVIQKIINSFSKKITIIYKKIEPLFPGQARNIGVGIAKSDNIAFLDLRSLPKKKWLESYYNFLLEDKWEVILGSRETYSDSNLKNYIKWASYGNRPYLALTGTLINKDVFLSKIGYFQDARAGEDIEWLGRIKKSGIRSYYPNKSFIIYNGLFNKLLQTLVKWSKFSFAYSKINEDINNQKKIYLSTFIYFIVISISLFFVGFDYINFFYFLFFIPILVYFIIASIYNPLINDVGFKSLFPTKWILIGFFRLLLDIVKFPGLIWGAALLIYIKLYKKLYYRKK